ncbi:MAG: alpha/beta fold hydrolase [Enterococcus sp.]
MDPLVVKRTVQQIPLLEVVSQKNRYEKVPTIIYYHGWQTSKELALTQGRKLAKVGFRVLLPDAANHGARKSAISKIPSLTFWESIYHNLFEFELLVNDLHNRTLLSSIGVGGVSMGGMTTCALLTHHKEIQCGACIMGTPAPSLYQQRMEVHPQISAILPTDYSDLLSWVPKYDLAKHPETLMGRPLLFWHGKKDGKIRFKDVESFVRDNEQTEEGKQIRFSASASNGHLITGKVMDEITGFFMENLKTIS